MGIRKDIESGYTDTLDGIIIALCKDLGRREDAVRDKCCSKRTAMEYEYINSRIHTAAREIAGDEADIYIHEIGERTGYAYSSVMKVSESTYKKMKKEIKFNIAKKLHMID